MAREQVRKELLPVAIGLTYQHKTTLSPILAMKTTLDLPDDLLIEAKSLAARRHTTLKAIVEHALRRELAPAPEIANPDPEKYETGPLGFLVLKRKPGETVTLEQIKSIQEDLDAEEFRRAIRPRRA